MREVHFFTERGPLCGAKADAGFLTLVARTATCPVCLAALEEREHGEVRGGSLAPWALDLLRSEAARG